MSESKNLSVNRPQDHEHFCYYPFTQMLLQPTGVISPCCWNQDIVLGQVPNKNLLEIWNDEPAQKLREEFLRGEPVSCAKQIRHIKCHLWSRRSEDQDRWVNKIQQIGPRRIDVRLNGKCNLQCIMCDVWQQPNGVYDQSDFWSLGPEKIFPFLREIDVLGGEPFIQGDTYRLIDQVAKINPDCLWAFVTNGNYKLNRAILDRLDKIHIRWIQVSIDSLDPNTYPQVRKGGELQRTLDTVAGYLEYQKQRNEGGRPFSFLISMCVQKLNWTEVENFIHYAQVRGLPPQLQFAYHPDSASLQTAEISTQKEAFLYFAKLRKIYGAEIVDHVYMPMRDQMQHLKLETGLSEHWN